MAQSSGPISQGTLGERQMTDVLWRDIHGAEPGVIGDLDGSAYALTLPTNSDIVSVGSATQASLALVAGFRHRIDAGDPEGIEIPGASGTARTDIIALRYDPAFTGLPGPVRLVRIAGTSSGLPTHDASPPGVEDMPLWGITRQPGQALSQATVQELFPRMAPSLTLVAGAPLPTSSPLGTVVRQGGQTYHRELGTSGVPVWTRVETRPLILTPRSYDWVAAGLGAQSIATANETGFGPHGAMAPFILPIASRVKLECQFRVGGPGAAVCSIKVDGAQVGQKAVQRVDDETVTVVGTVDLAAGSHIPSARVEANSGNVTWVSFYLTGIIGAAE